MSALKVALHKEAIAEARAAREWYEVRSVAAAEAFMEELDRAGANSGAPHAFSYGERRNRDAKRLADFHEMRNAVEDHPERQSRKGQQDENKVGRLLPG